MNTCGTCKFKGKSVIVYSFNAAEDVDSGYFECSRIKHDGNMDYKQGQGALVVDGSGYYAALRVEDDFGCVKWEPK